MTKEEIAEMRTKAFAELEYKPKVTTEMKEGMIDHAELLTQL